MQDGLRKPEYNQQFLREASNRAKCQQVASIELNMQSKAHKFYNNKLSGLAELHQCKYASKVITSKFDIMINSCGQFQ